jgi:hypothetical protein
VIEALKKKGLCVRYVGLMMTMDVRCAGLMITIFQGNTNSSSFRSGKSLAACSEALLKALFFFYLIIAASCEFLEVHKLE